MKQLAVVATLLGMPHRTPHSWVRVTSVARPLPPTAAHWSLEDQGVTQPPTVTATRPFAVYMGIVHLAVRRRRGDPANRIRDRGHRSAGHVGCTAIAAAAHGVLVALLPTQRGDSTIRGVCIQAAGQRGQSKRNRRRGTRRRRDRCAACYSALHPAARRSRRL